MSRLDEIIKELDSYKDIITKIEALEKEKKAIIKKNKEDKFKALPFEKQFEEFFTSSKGRMCGDLFELEQVAPLFYSKFVDDHFCLDRYQTYEIDMFYDELGSVYDEKSRKRHQEELGYDDEDFEEEMKEIIAIANELMSNNIRGWKQDW